MVSGDRGERQPVLVSRRWVFVVGIGALLGAGAARAAGVQGKSPGEPEQFVVYFRFGSAKLSSVARRVIHHAVEAIRRTVERGDFSHVKVIGYADTIGSTGQDQLSVRRAYAVRDQLVREGIDVSVIKVEGRGKLEPEVLAGDQVKNPRNRRTRIVIYRPGD